MACSLRRYQWPHVQMGEAGLNEMPFARSGMVLVYNEPNGLQAAGRRAARNPESRCLEIDIAREFLGTPGGRSAM